MWVLAESVERYRPKVFPSLLSLSEKNAKWPIGPWSKMKILKDASIVNLQHWLAGMESYSMYLLAKFGDPVPWFKEAVLVYVAAMRQALTSPRFHAYQSAKRVWARKPFPGEVDTLSGKMDVAKGGEEKEME